jgi:hypothetical protein
MLGPHRITVLHKTGTLGPSGRPGSTPGVGVYSESNRWLREALLFT